MVPYLVNPLINPPEESDTDFTGDLLLLPGGWILAQAGYSGPLLNELVHPVLHLPAALQ
jgi:hypothetical protein